MFAQSFDHFNASPRGQDLPRVPAFEESWVRAPVACPESRPRRPPTEASEEENEGDSKEGVHAPSTDSPQAATRGASEAPEKDAQTRNLEIEADMATATEHAAPGGEAPVEEANPEDGVHEAGIANQTAANMMKQAQDDDGKQADEADDELSRKAATTAHAAAGEEATPCSEHDSDAGIATVTTSAEAASGKARSNAQENAAVRLVRTPEQRDLQSRKHEILRPRPVSSRHLHQRHRRRLHRQAAVRSSRTSVCRCQSLQSLQSQANVGVGFTPGLGPEPRERRACTDLLITAFDRKSDPVQLAIETRPIASR